MHIYINAHAGSISMYMSPNSNPKLNEFKFPFYITTHVHVHARNATTSIRRSRSRFLDL